MTQDTTLSRRMMLSALLGAAAAPAFAETMSTSLRPPPRPAGLGVPAAAKAAGGAGPGLGALVEAAKLGGDVGIMVADAKTGEVLESLDSAKELPPASCMKALTSLYALERLGLGHRWTTQVIATGPISGGIVQGDLMLAGTGDPTLQTDGLGDLAAQLRARGVRGVEGRFLIHAGGVPRVDLIATDQPDHAGYNPSICGLNLNFNRVHFEWKRAAEGWAVTMDARGERFVPAVAMATMQVANREAPLFTYRGAQDRDEWTVASAALGKGGSRWLPVRHPEIYTGEVFRTLAAAQGIRLPEARMAAQRVSGTVVVELHSDSLGPVMRDMLRYSTNLTAEVVGLTSSGAPTLALSGGRMGDWLKGASGVSGRFVDHSGLGGSSRISASEMVRALVAGRDSGLPELLRNFGHRGADGKEVKGSQITVPSKTGTLNFVSGLAGYIRRPAGRDLVFAIFCADVERRDRLAMAEREQPSGGKAWTGRARGLQAKLIGRWAGLA